MRRDRLLIVEMIDAAERAIAIVGDSSVGDLEDDRLRREALLWCFTVLGEAASLVSDELQTAHPDVPWRNPKRLRNRVVHAYWAIDLTILHSTTTQQLPGFVDQLRAVLVALGDE